MDATDDTKAAADAAGPASTELSDGLPRPSPASTSGIKRKATSSSAHPDANKRAATTSSALPSSSFDIFDPLPPAASVPYKDCLLAHFFPNGRSTAASEHSLPGPQPASLTRGELRKIEEGEYWVCEKSDGERCILLLQQRQQDRPLLVDRRWSCRRHEAETAASVLVGLLRSTRGDTVRGRRAAWSCPRRKAAASSKATAGQRRQPCSSYLPPQLSSTCCAVERRASGRAAVQRTLWSSAQPPVSDGSGRHGRHAAQRRAGKRYRDWMQKQKAVSDPSAADATLARLDRGTWSCNVKEFEPKHNALTRVLSPASRTQRPLLPSGSRTSPHHVYSFKAGAATATTG